VLIVGNAIALLLRSRGVELPEVQQQLQGVLDTAEEKEWHLVGVAGGLPDGGMVLFWDTKRPSFGRSFK
jgi:hypothetical protein